MEEEGRGGGGEGYEAGRRRDYKCNQILVSFNTNLYRVRGLVWPSLPSHRPPLSILHLSTAIPLLPCLSSTYLSHFYPFVFILQLLIILSPFSFPFYLQSASPPFGQAQRPYELAVRI